ncbi:hypothetical protein GXW82_21010 [Streptacidiphilus sp. 4-A2]|nr:hypothetical protein [Streptacidiphilus sp. 4-A2]
MHREQLLHPPAECGLRYHWDAYVTLVVQVHGSKVWAVHPPVVEHPTATI